MNSKASSLVILTLCLMIIIGFTTAFSVNALPVIPVEIPDITPTIPNIQLLFLDPTNLAASSVGETKIQLTWDDNTKNETGFRVFRKETGMTQYFHIATTEANTAETITYIDLSAEKGKTYTYKVNAYNAGTTSGFSNEATVSTPILAFPDGLTVSAYTPRSITISWNDNSDSEQGYNVNIGRDGDMFFNMYPAPPNSTSYLFEGLTPGVLYWISVEAFDADSNKSKTEKISFRTPFEILGTFAAPTDLNANIVSSNKINLTWKDNSSSETGYIVERKAVNDASYITIANMSTNSEVYSDSTVNGNKEYMYRIKVLKNLQYKYSEPFTVNTFIPGVPQGLSAIRKPDNAIRLTWGNDTDYEIAYRVERRIEAGSYSLLGHSGSDTLIYDDNTATIDTGYYYRVCAVNGALVSSYSSEVFIPAVEIAPEVTPTPAITPTPTPTVIPTPTPGGGSSGSGSTSGTSGGLGSEAENTNIFDGTQSTWAMTELQTALNYELTYQDILNNYKNQITREEFCKIVVKLYEKLSGTTAIASEDVFTDTDDPEILKAYKLKLVMGIGNNQFAPQNKITRQEICVMIMRTLDAAVPTLVKEATSSFPFSDESKIAIWAKTAMRFCYKNSIMKGISATEIAPLNNTSREQAIILLKRTYEQYMNK